MANDKAQNSEPQTEECSGPVVGQDSNLVIEDSRNDKIGILSHERQGEGAGQCLTDGVASSQKVQNKAIYERAVVKRGGADFVSRVPAHPLRRRLRSILPISDLSADELVVQPATHPLSPRPREIAPPRCRQCTKR